MAAVSVVPLTREQQIRVEAARLADQFMTSLAVQMQQKAGEHGQAADEHRIKADEHRLKAEGHRQNIDKLDAELEKLKKQKALKEKLGMVKAFYEVFHGKVKSLTKGTIEQIFDGYLTGLTKKELYEVNTSDHFVRYINDCTTAGKAITTCDFTFFANKIKGDMRDLSQLLAQVDCTVTKILFAGEVPEAVKANFEYARLARGGSLEVVWA